MGTTGRIDAPALLRHILCSTDELRLDETQFRSLSQLYFREGDPPSLAEIESLISPDQLKTAIRHALLAEPVESALPLGTAGADVGAAAILKDSTALEIELSGRVAERLMKWAKIFGIFVAVPIAIVMAALAWIGISSISDIRTAAAKADELLASAKANLSDISKLQGDVQTQLVQLQDTSRTSQQKIAQLDCRTRAIERNLGARTAILMSGALDPGSVTLDSRSGQTAYGPFGLDPQRATKVASGGTAPWHGEFEGKKPGDDALFNVGNYFGRFWWENADDTLYCCRIHKFRSGIDVNVGECWVHLLSSYHNLYNASYRSPIVDPDLLKEADVKRALTDAHALYDRFILDEKQSKLFRPIAPDDFDAARMRGNGALKSADSCFAAGRFGLAVAGL